jgi:ABC-type lipoprotein release transport system permease subunit
MVFSSIAFMKDGLVREGSRSLEYAPDITIQGMEAGRQTLADIINIGYIQEASGVVRVEPRIWGYGNVGNFLVVIVGVDPQSPRADFSSEYPIESGSFFDPPISNAVVVGKGVAELLGVKVGGILTIISESVETKSYIVQGIFNSESSIYTADMILMNIDEARQFFRIPEDKTTDIAVYTQPGYDVKIIARQIGESPNMRVVTKEILLKAQETTFSTRSGFFSIIWYTILITVAIVAFNETVVVGHESKFEVGLLKALGFSTSDVIQIRLIDSTILGAIAASVGIAIGIFFDVVLNAPVIKDFMFGWAVLYPNFGVPIYISAQTVFLTYVITIVPLLFATVIPSWINATVDPDIAMRGAGA